MTFKLRYNQIYQMKKPQSNFKLRYNQIDQLKTTYVWHDVYQMNHQVASHRMLASLGIVRPVNMFPIEPNSFTAWF